MWPVVTGSRSSTSSSVANRAARCCASSSTGPIQVPDVLVARRRGFPARCRRARRTARRPEDDSIGIVDCQRVSQDLSALLDVEEDDLEAAALGSAYTLEVSSPGLDRPLRHEADYRRFTGRLAKLVTTVPVNGQSAFAGRLGGVEDGMVASRRRPEDPSRARSRRSSAAGSKSSSRARTAREPQLHDALAADRPS